MPVFQPVRGSWNASRKVLTVSHCSLLSGRKNAAVRSAFCDSVSFFGKRTSTMRARSPRAPGADFVGSGRPFPGTTILQFGVNISPVGTVMQVPSRRLTVMGDEERAWYRGTKGRCTRSDPLRVKCGCGNVMSTKTTAPGVFPGKTFPSLHDHALVGVFKYSATVATDITMFEYTSQMQGGATSVHNSCKIVCQ
jgi:hypothetical protein